MRKEEGTTRPDPVGRLVHHALPFTIRHHSSWLVLVDIATPVVRTGPLAMALGGAAALGVAVVVVQRMRARKKARAHHRKACLWSGRRALALANANQNVIATEQTIC